MARAAPRSQSLGSPTSPAPPRPTRWSPRLRPRGWCPCRR
ncbi:hypothetical protein AAFF_G00387870 [Aldrovandia affinis]|uniref:Uncharacterized protein n=1 Tax=Aldrovandia affinis TaxID=143900 RepID=A0AAD7WLK7_9TELE|nr:hypothetical protein AAFF_G00387870 [Aldrovandia affinis]